MNEKSLKIILGVSGILLGIFFVRVNGDSLFFVLAFILGALTVITNLTALFSAFKSNANGKNVALVSSGLGIILGVLLMFCSEKILIIAIGVYMIVLPAVDIFMSKYKSEQFRAELPKIAVGIALILIGPGKFVDTVMNIVGVILILVSAYFIVMTLAEGVK